MDTKELIGLINSVSTRTLLFVDYCKSGQTLQGENLTVDLATGRFHVPDGLLSGRVVWASMQSSRSSDGVGGIIIIQEIGFSYPFPVVFSVVADSCSRSGF